MMLLQSIWRQLDGVFTKSHLKSNELDVTGVKKPKSDNDLNDLFHLQEYLVLRANLCPFE